MTGSATLAWVAPTTNSDGSTLTDLAGFRIYYGTASGTYTQSVTVNGPYTTNYTLSALPVGSTYYLVVRAFDTSNNESAASAEVSKPIR